MKNIFAALLVFSTLHAGAQSGAYNEQAAAYIAKYKTWAIEEQQRTGVPAAITLAQGIHETQAGTSELATEANNHFGIKCKKNWAGETFLHTDDAPDECFRKYASAFDSYKDHSDYLKQSARYARCFEQDVTNYAAWARELKAAGYATNPKYAQKLIRVVEDFHLQDYTYAAMKAPYPQGENLALATDVANEKPTNKKEIIVVKKEPATTVMVASPATDTAPPTTMVAENTEAMVVESNAPAIVMDQEPTPVYGMSTVRNNMKGFYARKGEVLLEPAIKYNMRYAKLLELNDLPDAPLEADMFIYLEKKRGLGIRSKHMVKEGETLLQVAQAEGIQLRQLRTLNNLATNEEPIPGSILNLQTVATTKPTVAALSKPMDTDQPVQAVIAQDATMIATGNRPAMNDDGMGAEVIPEKDAAQVIVAQPIVEPTALPTKTPDNDMDMPVTKPRETPKYTPPPPVKPVQKTYTIADELAVGEEPPTYSPRYRGNTTKTTSSNTETPPTPPAVPEPQDEFSRLKAKLDKSVYAPKEEPVKTVVVAEKPAPPAAPGPASTSGPAYHIVKAGDTAYGIAKAAGISMKQLMDWNNLNFETLKTGQKLRVK